MSGIAGNYNDHDSLRIFSRLRRDTERPSLGTMSTDVEMSTLHEPNARAVPEESLKLASGKIQFCRQNSDEQISDQCHPSEQYIVFDSLAWILLSANWFHLPIYLPWSA
jgi:hypothetical protein